MDFSSYMFNLILQSAIFIYCILELIKTVVDMPIVHLLFHDPKEVLHRRIVVAITFAGHALKDPVLPELIPVGVHLVCPAAIRVKSPSVLAVTGFIDRFAEGSHYASG